MAKNFGKTIMNMVTVPAVMMFKLKDSDPDVVMMPEKLVGQQALPDGTPWKDVAKAKEGTWFIAVDDDGTVICCEKDPTMCAVTGIDIWQIGHAGLREKIFMQRWDGRKIIEQWKDGQRIRTKEERAKDASAT